MPRQPHSSSEHRHTRMQVYTPELGGPYPGTPITVIRRGRPLGCHWQQQMERHLTLSSNKVETCTFYSNSRTAFQPQLWSCLCSRRPDRAAHGHQGSGTRLLPGSHPTSSPSRGPTPHLPRALLSPFGLYHTGYHHTSPLTAQQPVPSPRAHSHLLATLFPPCPTSLPRPRPCHT